MISPCAVTQLVSGLIYLRPYKSWRMVSGGARADDARGRAPTLNIVYDIRETAVYEHHRFIAEAPQHARGDAGAQSADAHAPHRSDCRMAGGGPSIRSDA